MKTKARKKAAKSMKPGSLPYIWAKLKESPGAMFGLCFILALFVLSFISPWICPYAYDELIMKGRFAY